jgi:hypothetical protein
MEDFGKQQDPNANTNALVDQNIMQSQADLDEKRDKIFAAQLSIAKGQGGQNWNPTPIAPSGASQRANAQIAIDNSLKGVLHGKAFPKGNQQPNQPTKSLPGIFK